jgi:hypothetical protein
VASTSYRITPSGATQTGPWALYGYTFALNTAKVVKSLTLPANPYVVILGAELTGGTSGALNIAASGGSGQSTAQGSAFAAPLSATVTNSGTPVSGVTVTFTAPATGASASFGGAASATAVTNTSGVATSPIPTANATPGSYTVSATAPGAATAATFTLTNSALLPQTISFGTIPAETVGGSLTLGATASSGLSVTYTTTTPTICTITGSVANFIGVGSCSITAAQAGNASYAPAPSVTQQVSVAAAPVAGFSVSANPGSVSVVQGQSAGTAVTVTPVNGFAGTVGFSASGLPTGVTASFSPASATSGTTVTFNATASAVTGAVRVTITGTSGTITAATTVTLTVKANTTAAVPLSAVDNLDAIAITNSVVTGIGSDGYAYASALLPNPVTYAGASFSLGAADTLNAVTDKTIALPTGSFAALSLLGTGIYGSQLNQPFVVTYTDGSTTTFTQSLSDWGAPKNFTGETLDELSHHSLRRHPNRTVGSIWLHVRVEHRQSRKKPDSAGQCARGNPRRRADRRYPGNSEFRADAGERFSQRDRRIGRRLGRRCHHRIRRVHGQRDLYGRRSPVGSDGELLTDEFHERNDTID